MDEATQRALAALADGTLDPAARAELLRRIDTSPELDDALAGQRAARAAIRTTPAPASDALRATVAAMAAEAAARQAGGVTAGEPANGHAHDALGDEAGPRKRGGAAGRGDEPGRNGSARREAGGTAGRGNDAGPHEFGSTARGGDEPGGNGSARREAGRGSTAGRGDEAGRREAGGFAPAGRDHGLAARPGDAAVRGRWRWGAFRWPQGLRPRLVALGGGVAALVAAAVLLFGAGGPTVADAAQAALAPASGAAPAVRPGERELAASVDGVAYPYWGDSEGWQAVGSRMDHVGGRAVTTVFYANARGQRIGYAIAAGAPLSAGDGTTIARGGVDYRVLKKDGATVVTWLRNGHTCILAARAVPADELVTLASWQDA